MKLDETSPEWTEHFRIILDKEIRCRFRLIDSNCGTEQCRIAALGTLEKILNPNKSKKDRARMTVEFSSHELQQEQLICRDHKWFDPTMSVVVDTELYDQAGRPYDDDDDKKGKKL